MKVLSVGGAGRVGNMVTHMLATYWSTNAVSGPGDDLLTVAAASWDSDVAMSLRRTFLYMMKH